MIDSDFSNFVLEANDIIHGNFFLNDWQLTGLTFISTDLPYYSLMTLLFGIDIKSYAYASVLIFLVFVCACYFLVKDKLRISFFYKVIFFCIACLPCEFAFFGMRSHTGAITLSLLGLYNIYCGIYRKGKLVFFNCALAWVFFTFAVTGDSVCIPFIILPVLCISLFNLSRDYINCIKLNVDEIKISFTVLMSIITGKLLEKFYFHLGSASKNSFLETKQFITLGEIYAKLSLFFQSLLKLFNADFTGQGLFSYRIIFYVLGTSIVLTCMYTVVWNVFNYINGKKYDRIALTLSIGFIMISTTCIITNICFDVGSSRYYATAPALLSIVLLRTFDTNIKSLLTVVQFKRVSILLSLLLIIYSSYKVFPLPHNNYKTDPSLYALIDVLKKNNLGHGYSEFYTASSTTVYSKNVIKVRALIRTDNGLGQFKWFCKNDWYNDESHFIVVNKNGKGQFFTRDDVENHLGKPNTILLSDPYLIYVYEKDISNLIIK